MRIGLRYDLRSMSPDDASARYRAALDQCEWADHQGFDYVRLNEHHGSDDGYLPSPLVMAAAIAARTRRVRIRLTVLVLPLYNILRLAEDVAVADLLSAGRLELVVGAGYLPAEFEMLGVPRSDRFTLLEEGISVLRQAWTGRPFRYRGRDVRITPRPAQDLIPVYLGGSTPAAARRAARLADGFEPGGPGLDEVYVAERNRIGRCDGDPHARPIAPDARKFIHVAQNPEQVRPLITPFAMHEATSYARWVAQAAGAGPYPDVQSADDLWRSGVYSIMKPAECIDYALGLGDDDNLDLHPLMGGMPPELGWEGLTLFAAEVMPHLR